MSHTSFNWKRLLVLSQLVAAPLLGCNMNAPSAAYPVPDAKTLAEDSRYMNELFEKVKEVNGVQSIRVDMADDRQYGILTRRILASGNNPENSPMLFERLARMRQEALERKAAGTSAQDFDAQASVDFCGHWISVRETDGTTNTTITGKVIISCTNGSDYLYGDITAYDSNLAETQFNYLSSYSEEQYGNGKMFENVSTSVSFPKTITDKVIIFDSDVIAIDSDTGRETTSFVRVKTTSIGTPPRVAITHPSQRVGTSEIRTCLERGSLTGTNLDCDYATVYKDGTVYKLYKSGTTAVGVAGVKTGVTTWTADPSLVWLAPLNSTGQTTFSTANLHTALRGSFDAGSVGTSPCTITSYDTNLTKASIILTEVGGRCTAGTSPGTVAGKMDLAGAMSPGLGTRSFNTLANFGRDCLANLQNVKLLVNVASFATCGSSTLYARYSSIEVTPLDFKNSCLAEGTQVTLASGKKVAIEQVKVGDRVVANADGLMLTVTGIEAGGESQPMVRLKDDQGHEVLVTEKHPMLLESGQVVTAEKLKVSDKVKTDKGVATLTSVGRELYNKDVYNLVLGTPEELLKAGKQNRTLFANGFLVGDSQMQLELERQKAEQPANVLARISPSWHKDYKNDLARKASR